MLFTAVPPIMAPQTTGHPAALPQDVARRNPDDRVSAAKPGSTADGARGDPQRWHENPRLQADGSKKASAPPTILQIKINTMLEEQQEKLAQEKLDAARIPARVEDPETASDTLDRQEGVFQTGAPAEVPEAQEAQVVEEAGARPKVATPLYSLPAFDAAPPEHALSRSA